jgi:hypothetical protein
VRLSPLGTAATVWLIVSAPDDRWWWWLWRNRWNKKLAGETDVLGENLPPVLLYPPQIPHDLSRARTQAAAVGSRRLTGWAMARPSGHLEQCIWLRVTLYEDLLACLRVSWNSNVIHQIFIGAKHVPHNCPRENETRFTAVGVFSSVSFKARTDRSLLTTIKSWEGDVFGTLSALGGGLYL